MLFRSKEILELPFEKMTIKSYQVFTLFVEYLILKFGDDKILKLIDRLKQGNKLEDIFQSIYKKYGKSAICILFFVYRSKSKEMYQTCS